MSVPQPVEPPAEERAEPRMDQYAVLVHPVEPSLLLLCDERGGSLPHVSSGERYGLRVGPLNRLFQDRLGFSVTVLRLVNEQWDDVTRRGQQLFSLESHGPVLLPPGSQWVTREELARLALAVPEHRPHLDAVLAERASSTIPARRNAWALPGWFGEATAWIHQELSRHGIAATGPLEQFKTWSISCILQVPTSAGHLYLKAAPWYFAHEPRLTQVLSARFGPRVPDVLAIDPERRWVLMREFGGTLLGKVTDLARWEEALREYARIQVASCDHLDGLFSVGCPDRRLEKLSAQVEALLADAEALVPTTGGGLAEEEIQRLLASLPQFRALCAEVESDPVPPTLVHGDLHAGNIAVTDEGALFFDWTDGCVGHPFLDAGLLLSQAPGLPESGPRLRAAYLEPWQRYASPDRLQRLLERSAPLYALHQAVSYHGITTSVEAADRKAWASATPHFLRVALRTMEQA